MTVACWGDVPHFLGNEFDQSGYLGDIYHLDAFYSADRTQIIKINARTCFSQIQTNQGS